MTKPNDQSPLMGINVASDRKHGISYADLIVDGHKTLESRNGDTLRPYVGKRVAIVRTGSGPAKAIGEVTVGQPMVVNKKKFRSMEDQHHVPEGSVFDINTPTKHLYPMHDPVRYEKEKDVGHGIIARKVINMDKGGKVEVRPTIFDNAASRRNPNLEAAARALMEGELKQKAYAKLVAKEKPVKPYDFIPQPATKEDALRSIGEKKMEKWKAHDEWPAGRQVGLRLDIPSYERHGVWMNTVHDEEGSGEDKLPTAHGPVSSVRNATFEGSPDKAIRVATGEQNKNSFAKIKGELEHITEEEAIKHFQKYLNHPDYAQVGYDPRRHGDFYDRKTMQPVTHSEHVVQIGPLVLAKKPKYGKPALYKQGGIAHMAKGGSLTVEEMRRAIAKASGSNPPMAEKNLTNMQDFHTSMMDKVREGSINAKKQMDAFNYKYDKGHRVFTEDSAKKNKAPYEIIERYRHGNELMWEGEPWRSKKIVDPETGKAKRTPYVPAYRVRGEVGEMILPESAIKGRVDMARGGRVTHAHHLDIEERPL